MDRNPLALIRHDLREWNAWRRENYPDVIPDLHGAHLRGLDLRGADLRRVELAESNLEGANLEGANLYRSSLWRANLSNAILTQADLSSTNLNGANLDGANLKGSILRFSRLAAARVSGANFSDCHVYGCAVWNLRGSPSEQSNIVVTPISEPPITVDNIEIAQFVYLLLNNRKIRDVIDTIGKKAILILGRFTPERKQVLEAIRRSVRQLGFLPMLFDFDIPSKRDTQETIVTLAGLARFIIADITDPKSVPQELASIVPNLPSVPVLPIIQIHHEPWAMFDHIKRYPWVLPAYVYQEEQALMAALEKELIAAAERKALEMEPKRSPSTISSTPSYPPVT